MAIFRGGVKIFGSDVRFGITRDKSLDNIFCCKSVRLTVLVCVAIL